MALESNDLATALFGRTRRNVLALLFARPDHAYYLREIVKRTGAGSSQAQKELEQLVAAELVTRERRANQVYFQANSRAPIFEELKSIVTKTFGVADVLIEMLLPYENRLRLALLYGSVAKGTATASSDIDLLLVGDITLSDLVLALAETEQRLGRKISPITYTPTEFSTRLAEKDHFVSAVLKQPKIFLIGDESSLDELRQQKSR
ncbi:MAG: nucleotidyltransferase domain-containing protein, partial [Burkholderiales bacterium]